MRPIIISVMMIFLSTRLCAQENLVPNGSFEEVIMCPDYYGNLVQGYVLNWGTPNQGSPDFYHVCGSEDFQIPPSVTYGYEYPRSGEGFIGMYPFVLHQLDQGEYIQTRLTHPINPGVRYKVSFYVSLAELSRYAISSIGAYFSVEQIQNSGFDVFDVEPQIQNPAGNIIADTSGWVLITDTFASRTGGGEEWLTIGNFNYAAESDTLAFQPPNPDMGGSYFSYYYIDDVSVIALDSVPSSVEESFDSAQGTMEVWPNPVQEVLRFSVGDSHGRSSLGMTDIRIRVLDGIGREVTPSSALGRHSPLQGGERLRLNVSALPPGIYFLELATENGTRAVRKFVKE